MGADSLRASFSISKGSRVYVGPSVSIRLSLLLNSVIKSRDR